MPQLKSSKIFRGGITAPKLSFETSSASASVNLQDKTLDIVFDLASKGGGTTRVILEIGKDDFRILLQEIASKLPESAGILSDCTAIANKKNLELLEEARRVHGDERERATKLLYELESVEEFVSEKYYAAPAEEDEKEERALAKLHEVMNELRELR